MSTFAGPFFVIGVQRSGTTLIRMFLDNHSKVAIPFESMVLMKFYHRMHEYNHLEKVEDRKRLVIDLLSARGISNWNPKVKLEDVNSDNCKNYSSVINEIFAAYMRKCGKSMWGDKTPSYTQDIDILNELFPSAKFIHVIRDGRDVALSLVKQPWGPSTFVEALKYWADTVKWSRKMGRLLPQERYLEVKYETLVEQPKENVCRILKFLFLNYEDGILCHDSFIKLSKLPPSSVAFHRNLQRPVDASLAFKWRRRLRKVDQVLSWQIAGDVLLNLGYSRGSTEISGILLNMRKTQFWLKRVINLRVKRMKFIVT